MQAQQQFTIIGWIVWITAAVFFLYEFFLRTFLGALAPQVIPDLHLNASQFALIASIFYVSYGLMQVPVGYIADTIGVKKSMLLAIGVCTTAAFLFATSQGFYSALLYRLLMGFGGAFAFICLLVVTIDWFPKKYIAGLIGFGQFIGTMGALCAGGPLATVVSTYHIHWRFVFTIIGSVGVLLLLLTVVFVKSKSQNKAEQVIYLKAEPGAKTKMWLLLNSRQAWFVATYSAFVFLSLAMLGAVWGTIFLQSLGIKQSVAATIISMGWLGFALGCPILGAVSDKLVRRRPIMIGCSVVGFIAIALFVYVKFTSPWIYAVLLFLVGFTGSGQSIGFAIITEHVKPELKSMALGLNSAFITLLAAVMPLIVGAVIDHVAGANTAVSNYHTSDFILGFSLMPLLYALSLLLCFFGINETYCRAQQEIIFLQKK